MSERKRNIIVGLTAILGLVALGWLIVIFGEVPLWLTPTYPIDIHFADASGVSQGTRVKLNGIDIGFVKAVEMKQPSYEGVVLHCRINQSRLIPANALPLASAGLLGGAAQLNIRSQRPPEGMAEKYLPTDGSAELYGKTSGITEEFAGVAARLEQDLRKQLENFGRISEKIITLADQYTEFGKRITEMLDDQNLADVESGKVKGNVRTLVAHADQRLNELKSTLDKINGFVTQDMKDELKGAVTDVRGLTKDAREKLNILTDRFVKLSDDLGQTLGSTHALLEQARAGEGTVGQLMKNPDLYNSLLDTTHRLTDVLKEAKLLIQKWKSEGLPVKL